MLNLHGPPRPIDALVSEFLGQPPPDGGNDAGAWIASLSSGRAGPKELMARIQRALEEHRDDPPHGASRVSENGRHS